MHFHPTAMKMQQQHRLEEKRKSIGTLSTFSGPTKSISDSFGSFSDRDTTFSVRDSTIAPSTAGAPPATSSSSSSSSSASSSSDEDSADESERSLGKSDWAGEGRRLKKTGYPEDSDAWHSESEANWTLVEASFRNGRDIAQSQVLSEGMDINYNEEVATQRRPSVTFNEQSVVQQEVLPPFSEGEEEKSAVFRSGEEESPGTLLGATKGVASSLLPPPPLPIAEEVISQEYGFIPSRPAEVFGECSWNSLPLAIRSNLMEEKGKKSESALYSNQAILSALKRKAKTTLLTKMIEMSMYVHSN